MPDPVREVYSACVHRGNDSFTEWTGLLDEYRAASTELTREYERRSAGLLPSGWMEALPRYEAGVGNMASRKYSQHCIDALAPLLPEMMG